MAKKKEISKEILNLKKELEEGVVIIGIKSVLKNLKTGKLSKLYTANNLSEEMKEEVKQYSGLAKVPVVVLEMDNEELGSLCKKHFFISVLGVKKNK